MKHTILTDIQTAFCQEYLLIFMEKGYFHFFPDHWNVVKCIPFKTLG